MKPVGLLFLALVGLLAAAPAVRAASDPMERFYANTLVSKHEDGGVFEVYFKRDHSFAVTHDGKTVKHGDFTFKGGKLCFIEDGKVTECPPFRTDLKLGETWDAVNDKGHHDLLTLRAGRPAPGR